MLTLTIQIRAQNLAAARVAMRQAYGRALDKPLRNGPEGHYQYELRVLDEVHDDLPFTPTED